MAKLVLFGVTGYTGRNIVEEAVRRGHEVVGIARTIDAAESRPGVTFEQGSILDAEFVRKVSDGADVIISTVRSTPENGKGLLDAVPSLLEAAAAAGARLGIVGGAASLLVSAGGPRLLDTPDFHEEWKEEASNHAKVLTALRATDTAADWFYLSPPAIYGSFAPGERKGAYRVGADVLLTDAAGVSTIGGADFATAFVDEIDKPTHHRERFTVAY